MAGRALYRKMVSGYTYSEGAPVLCSGNGVFAMINFEDEIRKYQPMKDVDQIREVILAEGTADVTDLLQQMIQEVKNTQTPGN